MSGASRCSPLVSCAAGLLILCSQTQPALAQTQDALFDDSVLQEIRLVINSEDWETLKNNYEADTYYPVDLKWLGVTVRNAGLRSRGNLTRNGIKPGLHIDFNHYISDQELLGLKALNLKNMYTDGSLIRESVTMKLYARLGIPVPRESHARVYVNNDYVGVYVIVEEIDRTYLTRLFGAAEGNVETGGFLYKYRWVYPYGLWDLGPALDQYAQFFTPKSHETDSMTTLFAPIRGTIGAINETPDDRFAAIVGSTMDLPYLMKFLAAEEFVAAIDGLVGVWGVNNIYLYRPLHDQPALWIPWDRDTTYQWPDLPIDFNAHTNVLVRRAMRVPELRQVFLDTLLHCAAFAVEAAADDSRGWLEREMDREARQIAASVDEDPVKPFSFEQFESEVDVLRSFARTRPALVTCEAAAAANGLSPDGTCAAQFGRERVR
jgi:spore coat protein H